VSRLAAQRGAATAYFALFTLMALGFLVMAVDFGRMYVIQGELQTAADAAALAAATQLSGASSNVTPAPHDAMNAAFDSTTGNDNRFNLRLNQIGSTASGLISSLEDDYFPTLSDAQMNVGGQMGTSSPLDWGSGLYSKYVRVQINAQAPVVFAPFLNGIVGSLPTVTVSAIAGLSGAMCTVCGIEGLAVLDKSAGLDPINYGFMPGSFYTLLLTATTSPTQAEYIVLNHVPNGGAGLDDVDGSLFELGAGPISSASGLTPAGTITIDSAETTIFPATPGATTVVPSRAETAADVLCGLNARFGIDPSSCAGLSAALVTEFASLAMSFTADTDPGVTNGTMEDYAMDYAGNFRRVITVAIVDTNGSATPPNVLNFRQFLIEPSATTGVPIPFAATGSFNVQYIGAPVPLRCGGAGGVCSISGGVSPGVGRVVLH
jgi:hypothetical protein